MAALPFLVIGPTAVLSFIGLIYGEDKTIPTPADDWRTATVDLLIPAHNEEHTIVLCIASITTQTLKPRRIILIDDGSTDNTYEYAKKYSEEQGLDLTIIHHDRGEGKTPRIKRQVHESDADVICVLDGDTLFRSNNYIERLVKELYQGIGIACACGIILPLGKDDKDRLLATHAINSFSKTHSEVKAAINRTWFQQLQQNISDIYREELYLYLQKFIYHAEMVFFGGIVNPVGCAVAYRKKYIKDVFDHYDKLLGADLTTSEDIFIGFAFADYGYRNIQVQDVYAFTQEPRLSKILPQIFKWSSAFFQSCYYFDNLVTTPFKAFKALLRWYKQKTDPEFKRIKELRKIKEAYRQPFGAEYSKQYGRPIGWYVFTMAFEKVTFPVIVLIFLAFQFWGVLLITLLAEILLFSSVIAFAYKDHRVTNFFKSILLSPMRYVVLMFDLYVIVNFVKDLIFVSKRKWRK